MPHAHVPTNGFTTPKFHVIPKKVKVGMMLLHVPELQSIPLSLGTQFAPDACFVRQHAGLMIWPNGRIVFWKWGILAL